MAPPRNQPGHLHNGHDLANAAARSCIRRSISDSVAGVRNAAIILGRILADRVSPGITQFELVIATGKVTGADTILTAVYAGTGANRVWCFSSVFDNHEETVVVTARAAAEIEPRFAELAAGANFVFSDGIRSTAFKKTGRTGLAMPAWIKQRLRVHPDWASQLGVMRRGTRQEVARVLRKYGYACRLTNDRDDIESFYSNLYKPYVTRRFKHGALLVDRKQFLAECRRGVVLQLLAGQSVVGASLLRRVGNSLAIVWSALGSQTEQGSAFGATDALDYFSLLYAHLKGCRWLDFGPSRPDLFDGALRYKCKWGAGLTAGFAPQGTILFSSGNREHAEHKMLQRHAFVCCSQGQLFATAFIDGRQDIEVLRLKVASLMMPGIERYRVVALTNVSADVRTVIEALDPRVMVAEASREAFGFDRRAQRL